MGSCESRVTQWSQVGGLMSVYNSVMLLVACLVLVLVLSLRQAVFFFLVFLVFVMSVLFCLLNLFRLNFR